MCESCPDGFEGDADGHCFALSPVPVAGQCHGLPSPYKFEGIGECGECIHWFGCDEFGEGAQGCFDKVMEDDRCTKDFFTYNERGDKGCGCKTSNETSLVKHGSDLSVCYRVSGVPLGPYPGYTGDLRVTGEVNAYLGNTGNTWVTYFLNGLEEACRTIPEGVANACGIHIHEGTTCEDASIGGHYFATGSDPWLGLGYSARGGKAQGSVQANIGLGGDILGRAIVVHDSTGARVACALIPMR